RGTGCYKINSSGRIYPQNQEKTGFSEYSLFSGILTGRESTLRQPSPFTDHRRRREYASKTICQSFKRSGVRQEYSDSFYRIYRSRGYKIIFKYVFGNARSF